MLDLVQEHALLTLFKDNPHVVQVSDFDDGLRDPGNPQAPLYFMEVLEGKELNKIIAERKEVRSMAELCRP
jgi:hypothetical protein